LLSAEGHSFSDVANKVVSIINLASVADIERAVDCPVHPLRFRGNFYVTGWPAWYEFDLLDRVIAIGTVRLKVIKRIKRCAATDVDPDTGIRDLTISPTLIQSFGQADCGVYAEVLHGGPIAIGDSITT
jgi:MOSC domain-containing protein